MGIETIIGLAALVISAIAGRFLRLGHIRRTSEAEAKANKQRTEDNAAARVAVAERRVELSRKRPAIYSRLLTICLATMLIAELRDNWTRKG